MVGRRHVLSLHLRTNGLTVEAKPLDDAAEDIQTFSNLASPSLLSSYYIKG